MNGEQREVFDSIKEISYFKPLVEYINKIEATNLYKEYNNLKTSLDENQEVIDKAIEYIKDWQSFPHTNGSTHNELRNLLNILEGEDKDVKDKRFCK